VRPEIVLDISVLALHEFDSFFKPIHTLQNPLIDMADLLQLLDANLLHLVVNQTIKDLIGS